MQILDGRVHLLFALCAITNVETSRPMQQLVFDLLTRPGRWANRRSSSSTYRASSTALHRLMMVRIPSGFRFLAAARIIAASFTMRMRWMGAARRRLAASFDGYSFSSSISLRHSVVAQRHGRGRLWLGSCTIRLACFTRFDGHLHVDVHDSMWMSMDISMWMSYGRVHVGVHEDISI